MDDACMYYFEPKTDVFCVLFEFFCKPGSDVESETEDTCLIVSLGLFFISLGLKLTYFALREPRFNGGECICWA